MPENKLPRTTENATPEEIISAINETGKITSSDAHNIVHPHSSIENSHISNPPVGPECITPIEFLSSGTAPSPTQNEFTDTAPFEVSESLEITRTHSTFVTNTGTTNTAQASNTQAADSTTPSTANTSTTNTNGAATTAAQTSNTQATGFTTPSTANTSTTNTSGAATTAAQASNTQAADSTTPSTPSTSTTNTNGAATTAAQTSPTAEKKSSMTTTSSLNGIKVAQFSTTVTTINNAQPADNGNSANGSATQTTAKGTSKLALAALSTVPLLMVLGNSMLIPEFPQIKAAIHISQFQVGLLITLFSAAAGLAIPILGFLSDQYGRKIIIIPSVLLYGIGGVLSGLGATLFDGSYGIILVGRVVQGIGAAGTAPIVMAMVGDLYKGSARSEAMGVIEAANGMGKVLSPILGTAVALISWWALFFSYAILAIPIALAVLFLTTEPVHKGQKQALGTYFQEIVQIFKEKGPSLIVSLLAGMAVLFILFGVLAHVSDVLEEDYNLKGLTKGLVIAIPIFFMSTFSYLTGRFLKSKAKFFKISILVGLILEGIALIFLPFFNNPYAYITLLTAMGLGGGFVLPAVNTLVTSASASQQRGGVTSLYGSVRFIGVAIGPPTFSLLFAYGEKVMFWFGTGVAFLIATLVLLFLKEKKLLPNGNGGQTQQQTQSQQQTTKVIKGVGEETETGNSVDNKLPQ